MQGGKSLDAHLLRKRKTGELLALLLLEESHALTFDQIADALWQDKDVSSAQMLFHQATSTLRRILEPKLPEKFGSRYLEVAEGSVILKLPPGSTIDFLEFEKCCHDQDWEQALQFYLGDLLPCYLYCGWAVAPRERLKRLFLRALLVMAHRRFNAALYRESIDLCHRALEVDPWQEDAVMLAMRAYVALNDRASAIRVYQKLEKTLIEELQTTPQANLLESFRSLI
jgi:DNA-binding SARP family transcriptional activator